MTAAPHIDTRTWVQLPSGDWSFRADGEQRGLVTYQDTPKGRVWASVSVVLGHGPEGGKLTECKRRLETLWRAHEAATQDSAPIY